MSVTMASVFVTVHLFGFASTNKSYEKYDNWNQCVNSLEIQEAKFHNKPNHQITFDRERGYLAISDHQAKTLQRHQCQKE
jgi:hypothetical protein